MPAYISSQPIYSDSLLSERIDILDRWHSSIWVVCKLPKQTQEYKEITDTDFDGLLSN